MNKNKWLNSKVEPMALIPYWRELQRLGIACVAVGDGELEEEKVFLEARRLGFEGKPQDIINNLVKEIKEIQGYWLDCYGETNKIK